MKRKNYNRYGVYFVIPFFLVFLAFSLFPIVYTFYLSVTNTKGFSENMGDFAGLQNYVHIMGDSAFWQALWNTVRIWGVNFIFQMVLALFFAVVFTNVKFKLKGVGFFRTAMYMPNLLTAASISILAATLFAYPTGPINQFLVQTGIIDETFNFFRSEAASSYIVSGIQTWMWYGNSILILMAGISGIDTSVYEAAMVDGSSSWNTFRYITIPLLKPILIYMMVTSLVGGLQLFDIPFMITDGRGAPNESLNTVSMLLYNHAFTGKNYYGYSAAISVVLFIIIAFCSMLVYRSMTEKEEG